MKLIMLCTALLAAACGDARAKANTSSPEFVVRALPSGARAIPLDTAEKREKAFRAENIQLKFEAELKRTVDNFNKQFKAKMEERQQILSQLGVPVGATVGVDLDTNEIVYALPRQLDQSQSAMNEPPPSIALPQPPPDAAKKN